MRLAALLLAAACLAAPVLAADGLSPDAAALLARIDARQGEIAEVAGALWDYAEVGYREEKSSGLLKDRLRAEGFSMKEGVAGIPTAFVASYGSGAPVIAILAEFDALPGITQDRQAARADCEQGRRPCLRAQSLRRGIARRGDRGEGMA
jgi:aminobenzoyl-glutamate utilization protein B